MLACLYAEVATPIAVTFGAVILLVLVTTTWLLSWTPATAAVTAAMALALVSAALGGMDFVTARIEVAADFAVFVVVTVGVRATLGAARREAMRAVELQEAADRLDTTNAVLRTFTADAAHELRAPLTVLRAALERAVWEPDGATHELKLQAALAETGQDDAAHRSPAAAGQKLTGSVGRRHADPLTSRTCSRRRLRGGPALPTSADQHWYPTSPTLRPPSAIPGCWLSMLDNLLDNALAY